MSSRLSSVVPGPRTIVQATITNNNTITPNTAVVDLLRLTGVNIHGAQPVRISAVVAVTLTGTTNTVRTVFFTLTHGAGAGTVLYGVPVSLNNDEAATSLSVSVALDFVILNPAALATDQFALRWSTGANATANVNGTVVGQGGAVLNVEELTSALVNVGLPGDEAIIDTAQGTEIVGLLRSMSNSFAAALAVDPDVQLVDVQIQGGGAGNTYIAVLIYHLPQLVETVIYPRLADQIVAFGIGQDRRSLQRSSVFFLDNFDNIEINFSVEACSGDGAQWIELFLFEGDVPDDEEGLLAFRSVSQMVKGISAQPLNASRSLMAPQTKRVEAPKKPQRFKSSP